MHFIPIYLALLLTPLLSRPLYDRHEYLKRYEDEPVDEFLEMYRPNSDGSTFLDDAHDLWQSLRYEWRRGAGKVREMPPVDEREFSALFAKLRQFRVIEKAVPLNQVIKAEWKDWVKDPEFPDEKALNAMGIDEFIANYGDIYKDDSSTDEEVYQINHPTDHPTTITSAFKDTQ